MRRREEVVLFFAWFGVGRVDGWELLVFLGKNSLSCRLGIGIYTCPMDQGCISKWRHDRAGASEPRYSKRRSTQWRLLNQSAHTRSHAQFTCSTAVLAPTTELSPHPPPPLASPPSPPPPTTSQIPSRPIHTHVPPSSLAPRPPSRSSLRHVELAVARRYLSAPSRSRARPR